MLFLCGFTVYIFKIMRNRPKKVKFEWMGFQNEVEHNFVCSGWHLDVISVFWTDFIQKNRLEKLQRNTLTPNTQTHPVKPSLESAGVPLALFLLCSKAWTCFWIIKFSSFKKYFICFLAFFFWFKSSLEPLLFLLNLKKNC